MPSEHFKVFVVDDDPVARLIAVDQLSDPHFEVREFADGESCLAALEDKPDLVLLDIQMPGMNGIEVCSAIRESGDDHAQVVFVSAIDDLETRLAAYHAGGSDFILKPCEPEELAEKIRLAEQALEQRHSFAEQASYAQAAAFSAMSSLGEMGAVIQFLRASFACTNPAELAAALFEAVGQYGLHCLLELRDEAGVTSYSSQGTCTQLEISILGHSRNMDRIFQFRERLVVNYPRATLLVMNLPLSDPDQVGRLRDHLAIIVEGAEARCAALESEKQRLSQAGGIHQALEVLTRTLATIEQHQTENRLRAVSASSTYLEKLDQAFVYLGLNETQESTLIEMARAVTSQISELLDASKESGEELRRVAESLRSLARS